MLLALGASHSVPMAQLRQRVPSGLIYKAAWANRATADRCRGENQPEGQEGRMHLRESVVRSGQRDTRGLKLSSTRLTDSHPRWLAARTGD